MRCSPRRARRAARAGRASRCRWAARTAALSTPTPTRPIARRPRAGRCGRSAWTWMRAGSMPAYFRRSASSGARVPLQVARRIRPASSSKSASQIQETSRPSAILSLSTPSRSCSPGSSASVRSTSLAPAGFLTSRICSSRCASAGRVEASPVGPVRGRVERDRLGAAERGLRALQPGDDLGQANLQRGGQRGGGERVVDVVEAGQRQGDLGFARWGLQGEAGRAHALRA